MKNNYVIMTMNDYNNEGYVSMTMREYSDILKFTCLLKDTFGRFHRYWK